MTAACPPYTALRLMPGKVLLEKHQHPERTHSGLYIPETVWRHDSNFATVLDSAGSVPVGSQVCYYGFARAVHLDARRIILSEKELIADITGISSLRDIKPFNNWCAVLLREGEPRGESGLWVPDSVYRPQVGVVLTGTYAGYETVFRLPEGVHFRGDIAGVRFQGILAFVKEAAITVLIERQKA